MVKRFLGNNATLATKPNFYNNEYLFIPYTYKENHVNRKELAAALAKKTDSTNAVADKSIATLIEAISGVLKKGDKVSLVGFGTFEVRKRAARKGRNPATGAEIKIKASKQPAFKAGATLKAVVNGAKK
jgi:DNA-binding protein HU-beta